MFRFMKIPLPFSVPIRPGAHVASCIKDTDAFQG